MHRKRPWEGDQGGTSKRQASSSKAVFDPTTGKTYTEHEYQNRFGLLGEPITIDRVATDTRERQGLQWINEMDTSTYQNRRETSQDNRDRLLVQNYIPPRVSVHEQLAGEYQYNQLKRLEHMRLTGSPLDARAFRNDRDRRFTGLFLRNNPANGPSDTWYETDRRVYRCVNCGKYATPRQLRGWHNPGYRSIDITVTQPLIDTEFVGVDTLGNRRRISGAYAPPTPRNVEPQFQLFPPPPDEPGLDMVVVPTGNVPVAFTCSPECAAEQARYNLARRHLLHRTQDVIDRTTDINDITGGAYGDAGWRNMIAEDALQTRWSSRQIRPDMGLFFGNEHRTVSYQARHYYRPDRPFGRDPIPGQFDPLNP